MYGSRLWWIISEVRYSFFFFGCVMVVALASLYCKVVLPVSPVVHNTLRSVGECCEMVREFFVRVLHSSRVIFVFHRNCPHNVNNTNVFSCVGS